MAHARCPAPIARSYGCVPRRARCLLLNCPLRRSGRRRRATARDCDIRWRATERYSRQAPRQMAEFATFCQLDIATTTLSASNCNSPALRTKRSPCFERRSTRIPVRTGRLKCWHMPQDSPPFRPAWGRYARGWERHPRQRIILGGREQTERVPALAPRIASSPVRIKDDKVTAALLQIIASGKPCLPAADDDGIVAFRHDVLLRLDPLVFIM